MVASIARKLKLDTAWLLATLASLAMFTFWLAGAGWRWEGYPCFFWPTAAAVRYVFLAGYLAAVVIFLDAARRSAMQPSRLDGGNLIAAMICFVLLRVILATAFPLLGDEAYHWLWPMKLDVCYYDHPGLLAWVCYPFYLLSKSILAARAAPIVLGTIASLLVWRLAGMISGDRQVANRALAVAMLLPVALVGTVILFTDAPLIVCWLAVICFFTLAMRSGRLIYWAAAGVMLGLAFNCKFLAFALPVYLAAFMVLHRPARKHWRTVGPYLAVGIAAAMLVPVIVWNARHGWQTFYFNFAARRARMGFFPVGLVVFAIRQMFLVGPVFLIWAVVEPLRVVKHAPPARRPELAVVLACSWVPFVIYAALKLLRPPFTTTAMNWTAPLFVIMAVLFACQFVTRPAARWLAPTLYSAAGMTIGVVAFFVGTTMLGPQPCRKILSAVIDQPRKVNSNLVLVFAWPKVAREVDRLYEQYNTRHRTFVLARTYMHAAALTHYCRSVPLVLSYGYDNVFGRAYDSWNLQHSRPGDDALFVAPHRLSRRHLKTLRRHFKTVRRLTDDQRPGSDPLVRSFQVYYCRGMKTFPKARPKRYKRGNSSPRIRLAGYNKAP